MSGTRLMQLHLGKCIEDLDKLHTVPDLKAKKAKLLCKTAQKLFENAEQAREKGDEESSYVYYMKYLRTITYLSKDQEYQRDKKYFNDMLGIKNASKAIDCADKLKSSLIDRYTSELKSKRMHDIQENELIKQKIEDSRKKAIETITMPPEPAATLGLPGPDEATITCDQLYSILKGNKVKVMIMDARPMKDFIKSHIDHPACISVPEELISPGKSANVLEQSLPAASGSVWATRATAQLIVLLDWRSTHVIPGQALHLLKTILLKWDVKVQYARPPVGLRGGFEEWLLRYPQLATDPRAAPPAPPDSDLDDMLSEIDYPNWSDLVAPTPPVAPAPRPKPGEPVVDRSSKAAAVQMYAARARSMQSILEQQEKIADTSLTLEMQRLEAEQDWEKVRIQRESEQQDGLRAMYQLREQEIISQLMQMENKQFDMEQENQSLREKLEEYQRKEKEESQQFAEVIAKTEDSATSMDSSNQEAVETARLIQEQAAAARELEVKRARIQSVQEQRAALGGRRSAMENERKRRLAAARGARKPTLGEEPSDDVYMDSSEDSGGAGLSRSHSSPNIAKRYKVSPSVQPSSDDDEPPAFDRATKPAARPPSPAHTPHSPPRDLQPVWGAVYEQRCIPLDTTSMVLKVKVRLKYSQSHIAWLFRRGRGLTGLKNLGNTCYMNSIIQCLNNTAILVSYFCNGQYLEHLNRTNGTRGAIAEELAAVVRALWSGQYRFIAAKDLRNEVGKHQRAFRGYEQQDSHEFLTILMDWLHGDLQFTIKPPNKESLAPSEKAWNEYTKLRESLILRLFYGQIKSTVRCLQCGRQSATYETFSNLSLELPPDASRCTLADCMKLYLNGETIPGWDCPGCNQKRDAVKKLDISRLPPVLVIHFKRFYVDPKEYMQNAYRKKQTYIDFPLEDLDMRKFSLHCPGNNLYSLYAVSNHYGSMEGGHYTAYCKSSVYSKWYKYDDHVVSETAASDVRSSAAYILFYTACGRA